MSFSMRAALPALLLACAACAAGCSATRPAPVHPSGFLGDYSALQPVDDDDETRVYALRPAVLGDYDAFILDPVLVYLHPDSKAGGLDPAELNELAEALHREVADALASSGYEIVDAPGPRVLRIRTALTDVDPSRPAANVAAKVAGAAAAGAAIAAPTVDLGRASLETEMLDAVTGERVAAFMDARRGKRFMGTVASVQKWGHAHAAFKTWAERLRHTLDAAHAKP